MKRIPIFRYWLALAMFAICVTTHAQTSPVFDVVSLNGKYGFAPAVVPDPLVGIPSGTATTGYSFQWQSAATPIGPFTDIAGATSATLSFSSALTATTWYRRVATKPGATTEISNTVKYELVGTQWENMNYTRKHTVLVPGQTTWQQVDALSIGSKLVATAYYDGLGRTIQQVSTGTATPTSGSIWGDLVQHTDYDSRGLSPRQYLPFSTTSNAGKYKPTAGSLQAAYYTANYADSKPYAEVQYEQSPMARVLNAKAPGASWNAGNGSGSQTLVNTLADDVKLFEIGNNATDMPVLNSNTPTYADGSLLKVVGKDEQLKDVVTFYNANGLPVLKKVQLTGTDANPYSGWICTYYVYDLLGNLRCEINPEGVSWLLQNNWSFAASNGSTVFAEQCFVYQYDERGRTTYKKQPGQQPLYMLYDGRDRLVLTQDGNQRLKTPTQEWTAYVYDELDRPVSTYLYLTNAAITTLRQNAHNNPTIVSTAEQNNSSICTLLSTRYYDDYSFAGAVAFDQTAANSAAVVPAGAGVLVIAKTNRTTGFATGSITRVLGTSSFLVSTMYYDEEGSPIQSIEGNIKGGNDITTTQYGWDGRVLATATKHGLPGGAYHNHEILSKYNYDNIGRVTGTEQKIGANAWKLMSTKTFDDLGRTSTKRLDPAYNGHFSGIGTPGGGLETLTYSYNVQGTLIAINRAYALKEAGYNKWSNFFGLYLGYDANPGNVFDNSPRLNGQLRGVVWNTQGDDAQRRYQYSYDNAGRMTHANFADKATTAAAWSNTQLNFSETGNNETTGIAYSLNGNISNLKRYGHQMGQANAVTVDMLMYSYNSFSNKLLSVTDITPYASPTNPTTVGDFKEANTSNNDYEYDANGNLTKDLNKAIKDLAGTNTYGIQYNHLDKPTVVNIAGKGTITYTYTAGGQRLKRAFAKADGSATQVTWYMGAYIYTEVTSATPALAKPFDLQSIELGEARVRKINPFGTESIAGEEWVTQANITLPTGGGVYDYYITDHRSDVRLLLTEEQRYSIEKATMEQDNLQTGRAAFEQSLFGSQVGNTRIGKSAAPGWVSNTSSFISQLNAATASKVGPGRMLKVMAGDLVHASTQYYYPAAITNSTTTSIATQVLQALASNLLLGSAGTSATVKNATSAIQTNLGNTAALTNLLNSNNSNSTGTQPKAFLNVLFFDERFNFVAEGSTQIRVATAGDNAPPLAITNLKVPKSR